MPVTLRLPKSEPGSRTLPANPTVGKLRAIGAGVKLVVAGAVVLVTGELLLVAVVVVAELLATGVAGLLAVALFVELVEVLGVVEDCPLIANNFTVKIKSELGGMIGGTPAAPYAHAAETRRIARSPNDIWGTP